MFGALLSRLDFEVKVFCLGQGKEGLQSLLSLSWFIRISYSLLHALPNDITCLLKEIPGSLIDE